MQRKTSDFESENGDFWALAHAARGGMAPPGPLGSASEAKGQSV